MTTDAHLDLEMHAPLVLQSLLRHAADVRNQTADMRFTSYRYCSYCYVMPCQWDHAATLRNGSRVMSLISNYGAR